MTFAKYPVSGGGGGGSGTVVGPVSSVNNGVVLFDGTSGELIKDLGVGAANQVLRTDGTTPSFGLITNAFVDASAGIDYSKLAALAFDRALVSNGTGAVIVSDVTADELGFVAGVTSAIQAQINARALDSDVVHLTGDETIDGVKTFGSTIVGSVDGNAGTVTDGVYLAGAQTITGAKTFSAATTAIIIDAGASSSQRILFTGSGTNPDLFLAFQKTGGGAQSWDFGMNAGAISSDAFGLWNPTSSTVGVTFDPTTSAMSLYDTLTIAKTTNQIVLGSTNTTTITSVAPSASRVYTIPDAGGAASFVMTAGAQTIAGIKTFSTGIAISGGASANNTIYLQTNVFSIRGGTSGFSIRSTADVANLGVSDAGVVTIGLTSAIGGTTFAGASIVGKTNAVAVAAGYVGEVLRQTRLRSATLALTSAVVSNVTATSLTLTSGLWLVSAIISQETGAGATTSAGTHQIGISVTTVTMPPSDTVSVPTNGEVQVRTDTVQPVSSVRTFSIAPYVFRTTGATLFLVNSCTFSGGTCSVFGSIEAVRIA